MKATNFSINQEYFYDYYQDYNNVVKLSIKFEYYGDVMLTTISGTIKINNQNDETLLTADCSFSLAIQNDSQTQLLKIGCNDSDTTQELYNSSLSDLKIIFESSKISYNDGHNDTPIIFELT